MTWPVLTLPARSVKELTVTATVAGTISGESTNVAFATSPDEGLKEDDAKVTLVSPPPPPDTGTSPSPTPPPAQTRTRLVVNKLAPATRKTGQVGLYRITVRNTGKVTARNVIIADALPKGVSLVANPSSELPRAKRQFTKASLRFTRGKYTISRKAMARQVKAASIRVSRARANKRARLAVANGLGTWKIGNLRPGRSRTVTLRVRFTTRTGVVGNRATARAENASRAADTVRTRVLPVRTKRRPAVTG